MSDSKGVTPWLPARCFKLRKPPAGKSELWKWFDYDSSISKAICFVNVAGEPCKAALTHTSKDGVRSSKALSPSLALYRCSAHAPVLRCVIRLQQCAITSRACTKSCGPPWRDKEWRRLRRERRKYGRFSRRCSTSRRAAAPRSGLKRAVYARLRRRSITGLSRRGVQRRCDTSSLS